MGHEDEIRAKAGISQLDSSGLCNGCMCAGRRTLVHLQQVFKSIILLDCSDAVIHLAIRRSASLVIN